MKHAKGTQSQLKELLMATLEQFNNKINKKKMNALASVLIK